MFSEGDLERLRGHISRSVADQLLQDAAINWTALQRLDRPVLCIQASLQDGLDVTAVASGRTVSHVVDLSGIATPSRGTPDTEAEAVSESQPRAQAHALVRGSVKQLGVRKRRRSDGHAIQTSPCSTARDGASIPSPGEDANGDGAQPEPEPEPGTDSDEESTAGQQRRAISGLRPVQTAVDIEPDSQRQIHSGDKFPKRRKQQPERHILRPSSLDKLIQGIWDQIHGSMDLQPQNFLELVQQKAVQWPSSSIHHQLGDTQTSGLELISPTAAVVGSSDIPMVAGGSLSTDRSRAFKQSNVFCSKVTQASRACRSLEVIVQAKWVEHFDAYVDLAVATTPGASRARLNKAALTEACADFGWSEKDLRNKMAIWRGYHEIKAAGGWAALVFAGMGIYRFCKYRIGFDHESMARLRSLRPAIEVAADTLHPNWRALLAAVGDPTERLYTGHPHDHVVSRSGEAPIPLRLTYLQWDPGFTYSHIDECVVDERAWPDCVDPRWSKPRQTNESGLFACDACGRDQSDDPARNSCACFPGLLGCTPQTSTSTAPVMVFRTPDGKNNGLVALCPFERGAAVGEFVGLVTRGMSDVDVMESVSASGTRYQIWQGRQGNFTRFVNHSCKANAQYQRFTWLGTQRVVLVSKGIGAGEEITVDYSDKYWKGLDKKCLCGESCCRYRRD